MAKQIDNTIIVELVQRAKGGDQVAMNELFALYKGLIQAIANKFYLVGGDKDDLLQEGMLGLFYAVMSFDETKGSFPSFVQKCVVRQIIDAVKSDNSGKNRPLKEHIDISALEEVPSEQTPLGDLLEKEYAKKVAAIIEQQLTQIEQQVITLFAEGYSYEDIAIRLNKTIKAVDGAMQRARKKLLTYLFEEQL